MKSILSTATAFIILFSSSAYAEDLRFKLFNDSSEDLVEFNVSPASSNSWEGNLLRGGYLAPGYEVDVFIEDGLTTCVYDIRGIFSDQSASEDYNLDLCSIGEYTFSD